jgi:hypothetical protein
MIVAAPINANTFCAYNTRSAGEPTAIKSDVTTTAIAKTNHCKLYNINCPKGGRESIGYFRFIAFQFLPFKDSASTNNRQKKACKNCRLKS